VKPQRQLACRPLCSAESRSGTHAGLHPVVVAENLFMAN